MINIKEIMTGFLDNKKIAESAMPQIMAALTEKVKIADMRVFDEDRKVFRLQEFLINAKSMKEIDNESAKRWMSLASSYSYPMPQYVNPPINPPDTYAVRQELGDFLEDYPQYLDRYDKYTFHNQRLWQQYVDIYFNARKGAIGFEHELPDLLLEVNSLAASPEFIGCIMIDPLNRQARTYDEWRNTINSQRNDMPHWPLSRSRSNYENIIRQAIVKAKASARQIFTTVSMLGHEYRQNNLNE